MIFPGTSRTVLLFKNYGKRNKMNKISGAFQSFQKNVLQQQILIQAVRTTPYSAAAQLCLVYITLRVTVAHEKLSGAMKACGTGRVIS